MLDSKGKPRIGLLGIMHGLYDESQPQITAQQEVFARQVAARLAGVAEVTFPGAAKSRPQIEKIVRQFNDGSYDGMIIVMLLYSPRFRLIPALRENKGSRGPLPSCRSSPWTARTGLSRWRGRSSTRRNTRRCRCRIST